MALCVCSRVVCRCHEAKTRPRRCSRHPTVPRCSRWSGAERRTCTRAGARRAGRLLIAQSKQVNNKLFLCDLNICERCSQPSAGDTEIELAAESDWQVGDTIVLAPSDYSADEAERRVLTAVSNRGRTLVLDKAMAFPHFGEFVSTRGVDIDMRAEGSLFSFSFFAF